MWVVANLERSIRQQCWRSQESGSETSGVPVQMQAQGILYTMPIATIASMYQT